MNISSNDVGRLYRRWSADDGKAKAGRAASSSVGGTPFQNAFAVKTDSLFLGRRELSDADFVSQLGSDISNEVKAGKSDAYLGDLKMQIALGQYDVNADDVADRILGY